MADRIYVTAALTLEKGAR